MFLNAMSTHMGVSREVSKVNHWTICTISTVWRVLVTVLWTPKIKCKFQKCNLCLYFWSQKRNMCN